MSGLTKKAQAKKKKAKLRSPEDDLTPTQKEKSRTKFLSRFFTAMFVVPGLFGALITIYNFVSPAYTTIEVDNSIQLKAIFFGGFPWLITCAPYKGQPLNPIFDGLSSSAEYSSSNYKLGTIDCDKPMPNGKSVIDRFKLNKQKKYTRNGLTFTVANGGKPKVIPGYMMQNKKAKNHAEQTKQLNTYVVKQVQVKYGNVVNGAQLTKQCLSKPRSALVLTEGDASIATKSLVQKLAIRYRTLWFCVADRSKFAFSLEKKYPELAAPMNEGEGRLVLFRKKKKAPSDSDSDTKNTKKKGRKGSNDILMARPFSGLLTGPPDVDSFIVKTMDKNNGMLLMKALRKKPTLRYRGKGRSQKKKDKTKKKKTKKHAKKRKKKKSDAKKKPKEAEAQPPKEETPEEKAQRVEREIARRRRMDEQAQAHYAQAADDEEDEDEEEEDSPDEDEDVEEVYVDEEEEEEEDTIDLDAAEEGEL
jgi:hypothetical protein